VSGACHHLKRIAAPREPLGSVAQRVVPTSEVKGGSVVNALSHRGVRGGLAVLRLADKGRREGGACWRVEGERHGRLLADWCR
jgi:hypothetical protein